MKTKEVLKTGKMFVVNVDTPNEVWEKITIAERIKIILEAEAKEVKRSKINNN